MPGDTFHQTGEILSFISGKLTPNRVLRDVCYTTDVNNECPPISNFRLKTICRIYMYAQMKCDNLLQGRKVSHAGIRVAEIACVGFTSQL